jgi:hypothetical protein
MIFAELTGLESAGIIAAIVVGALSVIISTVALLKRSEVQVSPQPLTVEVVKALHEQFASKAEFDAFVLKTEGELAAQREILRKEIPAMTAAINAEGEKRIRRVHARIDPLVVGVASLCAKQGIHLPQQTPTDD